MSNIRKLLRTFHIYNLVSFSLFFFRTSVFRMVPPGGRSTSAPRRRSHSRRRSIFGATFPRIDASRRTNGRRTQKHRSPAKPVQGKSVFAIKMSILKIIFKTETSKSKIDAEAWKI